MRTINGFYSIVQYCPEPSRAEAANIGVLLFCPELPYLGVRFARGNDRVRRFFRADYVDLDRLNATKNSFAERIESEKNAIKSLPDLESFIQTRANELVVTWPRSAKVQNPAEEIESLFEELVGGRANRQPVVAALPQLSRLEEMVRKPSLHGRVRFDEEVAVPIVNRTLRASMAYDNGSLNLVKWQHFAATNRGLVHAKNLAGDGLLLRKHLYENVKRNLIVVPLFDSNVSHNGFCEHVFDIFDDFEVRTVAEDQFPTFVAEIEEQAH